MCLSTTLLGNKRPRGKITCGYKYFQYFLPGISPKKRLFFPHHPNQRAVNAPTGKWLKAKRSTLKLGCCSDTYKSGFHCFLSLWAARKSIPHSVYEATIRKVLVKNIRSWGIQNGKRVFTCGMIKVLPTKLGSFADILNEDTGLGYQRPKSASHSHNFLLYISKPGTSTIPLTFNLRPDLSNYWKIKNEISGRAELTIKLGVPCLAQVDCQHRLGEMKNSEINFAFMTYIGLDLRTEMALFNVINSKAKGLSSSLTDFHQTKLIEDLATEAPHLLIAKRLNEDNKSAWYKTVRYGGENNSGLMRRTSFRMLQSSLKKTLKKMMDSNITEIDYQYRLFNDYWNAVKKLFIKEWSDHRHNLLTKGIGLYSLMELLKDFISTNQIRILDENWFIHKLTPLVSRVDWSSNGMFSNVGGRKGAHEVYLILKALIQ
jgi:DGQHR domain-containing protein